jgi:hypothetical protein
MQVSQHLIGAPAPDETDAIRIDIGTQEGHGAGGAEGTGRDIGRPEIISGTQNGHGQAKGGSEISGAEAREPEGDGVEKGGQGLCRWCLGGAQVKNSSHGRSHGAKIWVATATEANDFTANAVLLRCEF